MALVTGPAIPWDEAMEAWQSGRFGDPQELRRLACASLENDEGCGISSSDINHTIYGAVAWGIRYDLPAEQVQAFLRAD